jgi:hypothetical protein
MITLEILSCLSKTWYDWIRKEWSTIKRIDDSQAIFFSQKQIIRMIGQTSLNLRRNNRITDISVLPQLTSLDLA